MSTRLSECSEQLEILNLECAELRSNYEKTKSYLRSTKTALHYITNQNSIIVQKLKTTREKISQLNVKMLR